MTQRALKTHATKTVLRRGPHSVGRAVATSSAGAIRCRRKFLRHFPGGFADETYLAWERDYKWHAHLAWNEQLSRAEHASLMRSGAFAEIARRAVRIESRTNLLFSFEKMALRDAVKSARGARLFAEGLFAFLYGRAAVEARFAAWCAAVAALPRRQTRVLTWPVVTVFPFLAAPGVHVFLKPNVTRVAAVRYGFPFRYRSAVEWPTYASLLAFAATVQRDVRDLAPRDMIDLQSFIWVRAESRREPERRRLEARGRRR